MIGTILDYSNKYWLVLTLAALWILAEAIIRITRKLRSK